MKNSVLLMFTLLFSTNGHAVVPAISDKLKTLSVFVYDISISTDSYIMLNSSQVESIYSGMGKNGGGKFYGLHIQSNSAKQNPIMAEVKPLNLLPLKGNAYQKANIEKMNKRLAAEFDVGQNAFVTNISNHLIQPKSNEFSDVKNALELAKKIMENPMYVSYAKKLIIVSDMENDLPPKQGIDRMSMVQFPNDVNIFLVRPSDQVNISRILTGNISIYTTIEDAIESMFNLKN